MRKAVNQDTTTWPPRLPTPLEIVQMVQGAEKNEDDEAYTSERAHMMRDALLATRPESAADVAGLLFGINMMIESARSDLVDEIRSEEIRDLVTEIETMLSRAQDCLAVAICGLGHDDVVENSILWRSRTDREASPCCNMEMCS